MRFQWKEFQLAQNNSVSVEIVAIGSDSVHLDGRVDIGSDSVHFS